MTIHLTFTNNSYKHLLMDPMVAFYTSRTPHTIFCAIDLQEMYEDNKNELTCKINDIRSTRNYINELQKTAVDNDVTRTLVLVSISICALSQP